MIRTHALAALFFIALSMLMTWPLAVLLEQRPKGVPRNTDVQVEIVDGRGAKTFLEGRFVRWNE